MAGGRALRPEGKNGPLVRTLESHRRRTTSGGPRPGSSRRCSRRGRSPATSSWGRPTWPRSRPMVWQAAERDELRRGRAGDAPAGRASTCPAAEADRQLKLGPGRAARRRVQRPAAAARARSRRRRRCARGTTLEALAALAAAGTSAREDAAAWRRLPAAAHAGAPDPAVPAAPHPPDADRRGGPAPAGPRGRPPARPGEGGGGAVAGSRPARCAGSTSGSSTGRCSTAVARLEHRRGAADPGGRTRAPGRPGFPRPRAARCATSRRSPPGSAAGPRSSARCCR